MAFELAPGYFHFSREEVVAEAGVDPWQRQEEFSREIRPDDMAETAAVYLCAHEVDDAGELAESASRIAAEAGELDGASLVDADGRIRMTTRDLADEKVREVVAALQRAMNLALDTEEQVRTLVWDPGLDLEVAQRSAAAIREWDAALPGILAEAAARAAVGGLAGAVRLAENRAAAIRARHLSDAADDAEECDQNIRVTISAYRTTMARYASALEDDDYDVTRGPFGLFTEPRPEGGWVRDPLDAMQQELTQGL
jgi:hypothetical protein